MKRTLQPAAKKQCHCEELVEVVRLVEVVSRLLRWISTIFVRALVASCLLLAGCTTVVPKRGVAVQSRGSGKKVLVGIDITGSYALLPQALPLVADFFMMNSVPGDTWIFRWIERNSYSDRAAIPVFKGKSSVTLPPLCKPPNPFDKRGRVKYLLRLREVIAIRKQVTENLKDLTKKAQEIRTLQRERVRGTDIWGFLIKAQDLGVSDIVMFTDLGDTMRNEMPLRLDGVRVWILGFQSGKKPKETSKRRAYWTSVLRKAGVSEISFFDISEPLPILPKWEGGEF